MMRGAEVGDIVQLSLFSNNIRRFLASLCVYGLLISHLNHLPIRELVLIGGVPMEILDEPVISVCLECGGRNIIQDLESGEVVCGGCGLVIAESTISTEPEWRAFTKSEEESRIRVGLPLSFSIYDKGLSTTFLPLDSDAYGRRTPNERKNEMRRLKKWHTRSNVDNSERSLAQAMSELDRLCDGLHLPNTIQEKAAVTYRKVLKEGFVRGRRISAIVAASLYVACRVTQTPRTLAEVARCSHVDKKEIARCYRILLKKLNLRVPVPKAQLRVSRIASKVELGEKTQRMAIEILGEADRLKISVSKDPMGLAASALYIACVINGEKRTQEMIAEAAGVTEVTIRNRYQELKRVLNLDRFKPERG
jgi:transcription initiation factor TFIIB